MKNLLMVLPLLVGGVTAGFAVNACTTGGEHGIRTLEEMTETEFNKWKLYIQLGVKISANRLLLEGVVDPEELELTATVLETVRDQTPVPGVKSFITTALKEAGLTNDELELLLLVVEQELVARGALSWTDPTTGVIVLMPRTKEMLTIVAASLRSAASVTPNEVQAGESLQQDFNFKLIRD